MKKIGLDDVMSLLGVTLIGAGIGMISIPVMLITVGGILLAIGLVSAWRNRA